jgi:uncharacterized membrane protein SpoIIM required for sporulation
MTVRSRFRSAFVAGRPYLAVAAGVLLLGCVAGTAVSLLIDTAAVPDRVVDTATTATTTERVSGPGPTYFLLRNGVVAAVLAGGAITVGGATIVLLLINGFYLGAQITAATAGGQFVVVAVSVVPHGVFEVPGLLLAGAAGLLLPGEFVRYLFGWRPDPPGWVALRQSVLVAAVGLLNIAVAAVVEGFVTPLLLTLVR